MTGVRVRAVTVLAFGLRAAETAHIPAQGHGQILLIDSIHLKVELSRAGKVTAPTSVTTNAVVALAVADWPGPSRSPGR